MSYDLDPGDKIEGTSTNFCALYDAAKAIVGGYEEWTECGLSLKAMIKICSGVAVLENILLEDGMEIGPQIRDYLCKHYESRLKNE